MLRFTFGITDFMNFDQCRINVILLWYHSFTLMKILYVPIHPPTVLFTLQSTAATDYLLHSSAFLKCFHLDGNMNYITFSD